MGSRDREQRTPHVDIPYRRLAEAGVVAAFVWHVDGRVTSGNELFLRIVGRTRDDLDAGRINWRQMLAPGDQERADRHLQALRARRPESPVEVSFVRPDGTVVPVLTASAFLERSREWGVSILVDLSDRRRLESERDQALRRLRLLAEASRVFTEPLDRRGLARALVELIVPQLVDWAAVYLPDGDVLRRASVRHAARPDLHTHFVDRYPVPASSDAPVALAARLRELQLVEHVPTALTDEVTVASGSSAYREAMADLGLGPGVVLPIASNDEVLAVLAIATAHDGAPIDGSLLDTVHELVGRAAVAFQRAKSAERDRHLARAMQFAALPRRRPVLPGHEFAACYVSSGEANLGGDWWDAVALEDGRLALVVGDVVGHGVAAASVMAALRHSLRALLQSGMSPADALRSINSLALAEDPPQMASVVVVVYDPTTRGVTCANAGHYAPLLVDHDTGEVEEVPCGKGPILGAIPDGDYVEDECTLPERFELLLYTDGFTERRNADEQCQVDAALLRELVDPTPAPSLQTRYERMVGRFSTGVDDACVLAMQRFG